MKNIFFVDIKTACPDYEAMIQSAIHLCDREHIPYSKVSVYHILEAPLALRFAVDAFRSTSLKNALKPDGYVVFGFMPQDESFDGVVYEEALRSLQDVGCYYGLALSHYTFFEGKTQKDHAIAMAEQTILSALNLIDIKKQLGLHPQHMTHL